LAIFKSMFETELVVLAAPLNVAITSKIPVGVHWLDTHTRSLSEQSPGTAITVGGTVEPSVGSQSSPVAAADACDALKATIPNTAKAARTETETPLLLLIFCI
jgi:hypothetical protein